MFKQLISFLSLFIIVHLSLAQTAAEELEIQVEMRNTFAGSEGQPFWLHVNLLGKYDENKSSQGLLNFTATQKYVLDSSAKKYLEGGLNLLGRYYGNETIKFLEYWGCFNYEGFYLHAGAKSEPEFNRGLSITNGDLYLSNNARPMPRIEFGAKAFHPFQSGFGKKFTFDGLYSEYFLLDERYIKDAHLHHKSFGINYELFPSWTVSLAFDHWAFWGGEFPNGEDIPGFEYYFKYIFGKKGGEKSIITEQQNANGNHTGQYLFSLKHKGGTGILDIYWQHIWEDGTGLKLKNATDGLLGVAYSSFHHEKILNGIVFEYVNTKHQSGRTHDSVDPDHLGEFIGGNDNYFNHYIYRSGFTSYGRMIGLPLLIPGKNENGISTGFESNRLWGVHSGVSGSVYKELFWKVLLTYSKHFGTHASPCPNSKDLFSAGFNIEWNRNHKPFSYQVRFAFDRGSYLPKTEGIELRITYSKNK